MDRLVQFAGVSREKRERTLEREYDINLLFGCALAVDRYPGSFAEIVRRRDGAEDWGRIIQRHQSLWSVGFKLGNSTKKHEIQSSSMIITTQVLNSTVSIQHTVKTIIPGGLY
jgi:hypothetical protein